MANPGTGDDDSIISTDRDERSVTIRGRTLEPADLTLILLAVGIIAFAAITTSAI